MAFWLLTLIGLIRNVSGLHGSLCKHLFTLELRRTKDSALLCFSPITCITDAGSLLYYYYYY